MALATFAPQRTVPYKETMVVTGVLIGFVLVVMVGQTAHTMQGTGWLPIRPVELELPYWLGLWFVMAAHGTGAPAAARGRSQVP